MKKWIFKKLLLPLKLLFYIIIGGLIGLITWMPRVIIKKYYGVNYDIYTFLDKWFPLIDLNT